MRKLVLYIETGFAGGTHREEIDLEEFLVENDFSSVEDEGFEDAALNALEQFRLNTISDGFYVVEDDGTERRDW